MQSTSYLTDKQTAGLYLDQSCLCNSETAALFCNEMKDTSLFKGTEARGFTSSNQHIDVVGSFVSIQRLPTAASTAGAAE